jgi:hypothetical protein
MGLLDGIDRDEDISQKTLLDVTLRKMLLRIFNIQIKVFVVEQSPSISKKKTTYKSKFNKIHFQF